MIPAAPFEGTDELVADALAEGVPVLKVVALAETEKTEDAEAKEVVAVEVAMEVVLRVTGTTDEVVIVT